jgi:hypothetical protein
MNKVKYLNDVLTSLEAEDIISNKVKLMPIDKIGSEEFLVHHSLLERLNMQAIKNALLGGDDFILEYFVTYEKIKELIAELFTISNFKSYIYPRIKSRIPENAFCKVYICLYHEAVVVNLLENFFFHVTACQASEDFIIDVIEYCYNKISKVINNKIKIIVDVNQENLNAKNSEEEFDNKNEEIEFYTSMACISIIRYITDHLNSLPFPVRNHIMNNKDTPLLLVSLMELKPWLKENEKKEQLYFENNVWNKMKDQSANKLTKLEAQVWISLFNLLMGAENNKKYEITEYRKSQLLRLRKYLNESLYDHIPPLNLLFRALEEMSLIDYSSVPTSNPFVVEMIPILSNKKISEEDAKRISEKILNDFFPKNYDKESFKREMDIISAIYNVNNIEYFMDDPKCANCGKDATNRCSKCKSEWYCGKDCQIKRWKMHKQICAQMAELNNQTNDQPSNNLIKEVETIQINKVKTKEFDELD